MDALHWVLFAAIGLLAASLLCLSSGYRQLERRLSVLEASPVADEARRAHVRLDSDDRRIRALARELGWTDDRAHTRVVTIDTPLDLFKQTP